ncbi:MAG: hypothetical protein KC457_29515, partial [Myxococcales bacterium]|nr:hypothetical protein [Myxococcales bacterium]
EALAGERPYPGQGLSGLMAAIRESRRRPFPRSPVPESLVRALERGLAPAPADRWPDMATLLEALRPAPPPRRNLAPLWTGLVLALGIAGGLIASRDSDPAPAVHCEADDARLAGIWDEPRKQALEAAFVATDLPWAQASADSLRTHLDAWVGDWQAMAVDACEAHHLRHQQSAALFDRRMTCLDAHLRELDSLVGLLTPGPDDPPLDATVVGAALTAGLALDGVEVCGDAERLLARRGPEDPAKAEALAELQAALVRREQLQDLGQFERAMAAGRALLPQLEAVDDPAAWGTYHGLEALDLLMLGRGGEALASATAALGAAGRSGDPDTILHATLILTRITLRTGRIEESTRWQRLSESLSEQATDPWFRFELHKARAFLATTVGDRRGAESGFADALAWSREHHPPDSFELAVELLNHGTAAIRLGLALRGDWPPGPAEAEPTNPEEVLSPAERRSRAERLIIDGLAETRHGLAQGSARLTDRHPIMIAGHLELAGLLVALGRDDEVPAVLDRLEAAVAELPITDGSRRSVELARARSLAAAGHCDRAFAKLDAQRAALEADGESTPAMRANAAMNAAALCQWSHPQARALLDQAVDLLDPDPEQPASTLGAVAHRNRALS